MGDNDGVRTAWVTSERARATGVCFFCGRRRVLKKVHCRRDESEQPSRRRNLLETFAVHTSIAMRVLIMGASGPTGQLLAPALAEKGHFVVTFSREKTGSAHPRVRHEFGDATDSARVFFVLRGVDAVVVLLSHRAGDAPDAVSAATESLVHAMTALSVRRIVCVSDVSAGKPRTLFSTIFGGLLKSGRAPDDALTDRQRQESIVRNSGLDWVIVRPARLTANGGSIAVRADDSLASHATISRPALVDFLVTAIDPTGDLHERVVPLIGETNPASIAV